MIKIEKNDQKINPFGGVNFVINEIKNVGVLKCVDNQLGARAPQAEFSY